MELLTLVGIVLSASILESFLGVLCGRRTPRDTPETELDDVTEGRYSRLGSEYDVIEAD